MPSQPNETTGQRTARDWAVIRGSFPYNQLPEVTLNRLFEGVALRILPKGATLCRWNAPADACFLILDGLVKVFREAAEGQSAVMAIHGAGRTVMLAEALVGGLCSASIEAVGPVRVAELDARRLRALIAEDSALGRAMLASASAQLRMLVAHVEELKTMTGPARLADMILSLAGTRTGSAEVTLPYEKTLIANRLGMMPESLSRAMKQLKAHGVTVSRDRLKIRDLARLRAFATPDN